MATIKSEYYRFNGVSWDIHYFKTTMDMVDGLTSALAGKVGLAGNETITGVKTFSEVENLKVSIGANKIVMVPDVNSPFQNPVSKYLWHDLYAFCRHATPTYEVSSDNVNWTPTTLSRIPFDQKNMSSVVVINKSVNITGARWTWNSSNLSYSLGRWLVIGTSWVSASAVQTYLFESSADGINWTQRFLNTAQLNASNAWLYIGGTDNHPYHRLTITIPVSSASNVTYSLNSIKLLSARWGDQGAGSEYEFPYSWDENMNMQVLGQLREGANRVYSAGNKPSLTDLGALIETNQKLLFGGTTQYIRLAYAGKSQAFIKHGGGTEYEVWTTGNFNPSDYMPKSGGTFTGTVSFTGLTSFDTLDINSMYVDTITADDGNVRFTGLDYVDFNLALLRNVADPIAAGDAVNKAYLDARVTLPNAYTVKLQKDFVTLESATDVLNLSDEGLPTLRCGSSGDGVFEITGNISATLDIYTRGKKVATEGPTASKSANYTFVLADANGFIYSNLSSALTFTIPTNASAAFPIGTEIHVMRYGSGELSIAPASGVSLVSEGGKRRINAQYQAATLKKINTDNWVLIGAIKS